MNRTGHHSLPFTAIAVAIVVAGCAASGDATDNASPTTSETLVTPSISTQASLLPSPALAPDTVAELLVNDLTVRSAPGVGASPVPCDRMDGAPVRLATSDVVWMLDDEPVIADGYSWYHTVVQASQGCSEVPILPGWVAAGPTGEPWLRALDACPATPTSLADVAALADQPLLALACFSQFELTIEGFYRAPPDGGIGFTCPGISPSWLTCGISMLRSDTSTLTIRVPPTVAMPAAEQQMTVTGHFDDAAAQECLPADPNHIAQVQATFYCRVQFAISSATTPGAES